MPFVSTAIAIASIAAVGTSVAGTAISAVGQTKAGDAAQQAAQYNADRAIEEAGIREQQQRTQDRAILAHSKAMIGTSGVTVQGSPLDVLAESTRQAEMNALIIRRGGQLEAQSQLYSGNAAKSASNYNVASTILGGASKVVSNIPSFGGSSNGIDPLRIGALPLTKRPAQTLLS